MRKWRGLGLMIEGGVAHPLKGKSCSGADPLIQCQCGWKGLETELVGAKSGLRFPDVAAFYAKTEEAVCPICKLGTITRTRTPCQFAPQAKCLHCGKLFCRIHIDDHLKSITVVGDSPTGKR